jgi:cobalt/nickel transport system permease protein
MAAAIGVAIGAKTSLASEKAISRSAVLGSTFFLASLVHIRFGGASVHLSLAAPLGLVLGWGAFPAIMAALLLQAVLFQFGGLLSLGVNTTDMAFPAVVMYALCSSRIKQGRLPMLTALFAGFTAPLMSAAMAGLFLWLSNPNMAGTAALLVALHLPVAVIESVVTLFMVSYLRRHSPDVLAGE